MMYNVCNRHPLSNEYFVGCTSIIHHLAVGVFILCNICYFIIYSCIIKFEEVAKLRDKRNNIIQEKDGSITRKNTRYKSNI